MHNIRIKKINDHLYLITVNNRNQLRNINDPETTKMLNALLSIGLQRSALLNGKELDITIINNKVTSCRIIG
jgi:hypothetical protein